MGAVAVGVVGAVVVGVAVAVAVVVGVGVGVGVVVGVVVVVVVVVGVGVWGAVAVGGAVGVGGRVMREIGRRYLFRTVPFFFAGTLVHEDHAEHAISEVEEVFDTGEYPKCLNAGSWKQAEAYPKDTIVYVPRGCVVVEIGAKEKRK